MNKTCLLLFFFSFLFLGVQSQQVDSAVVKKNYLTKRLSNSITLDGIPNEETWNAVEWGGDFTQYQPNEGKPPSQQTNFKILYDDNALYIAYRAHDTSPG